MNSARIFASRNHIIDWINAVLQIKMNKIEQLGSGVIYCLLLDAGYPNRVPLNKLKWYANNQVDFIFNFKILQTSFSHLGIDKKIDINRLVKAKHQDNLDFIQWLKFFLQPKIDLKHYDPKRRRENRSVCLDFYEHKILKLPSQSHKTKEKSSQKSKHLIKINKELKKIYNTNTSHLLEIYDYKTDESDYEINVIQEKKYFVPRSRMPKTAHLIPKKPNISISVLDDFIMTSDKHSAHENKENACLSMNNTTLLSQNSPSLQCMYNSPKEIKKFFFPERFSERLKRRVDVINSLRKSQMKRGEDEERLTVEKPSGKKENYKEKDFVYVSDDEGDVEVKVEA